MSDGFSGGLPVDFVVVDLKLGFHVVLELTEIGEHPGGGEDGLVGQLAEFGLVSGYDTVSF